MIKLTPKQQKIMDAFAATFGRGPVKRLDVVEALNRYEYEFEEGRPLLIKNILTSLEQKHWLNYRFVEKTDNETEQIEAYATLEINAKLYKWQTKLEDF